jgi:predicted acyl esterase
MFETGSNQWKKYNTWPPAEAKSTVFFLGPKNSLAKKANGKAYAQYDSDPANPVPILQ